jgi:hypothetical protein
MCDFISARQISGATDGQLQLCPLIAEATRCLSSVYEKTENKSVWDEAHRARMVTLRLA